MKKRAGETSLFFSAYSVIVMPKYGIRAIEPYKAQFKNADVINNTMKKKSRMVACRGPVDDCGIFL